MWSGHWKLAVQNYVHDVLVVGSAEVLVLKVLVLLLDCCAAVCLLLLIMYELLSPSAAHDWNFLSVKSLPDVLFILLMCLDIVGLKVGILCPIDVLSCVK